MAPARTRSIALRLSNFLLLDCSILHHTLDEQSGTLELRGESLLLGILESPTETTLVGKLRASKSIKNALTFALELAPPTTDQLGLLRGIHNHENLPWCSPWTLEAEKAGRTNVDGLTNNIGEPRFSALSKGLVALVMATERFDTSQYEGLLSIGR